MPRQKTEQGQATPIAFVDRERSRQSAYFSAQHAESAGFHGSACRLQPESKHLNLAPKIRQSAVAYFGEKGITWHQHANHGLSSQVCCLNFLLPLAENPAAVALFLGEALSIDVEEVLDVERGPSARPWYIAFEWNGEADYLNEAGPSGKRTRGANSTSADAYIRFRHQGNVEGLLIEWKYTESYGPPIAARGNATRVRRYEHLVFDPRGPVRADLDLRLEDFFYEPFYQLVRQQMLAHQMELAGEGGVRRVRVLHISPEANRALRVVTSPELRRFGGDAFVVFQSLLSKPQNFVSKMTERLFRPLLAQVGGSEWSDYLSARYPFLMDV